MQRAKYAISNILLEEQTRWLLWVPVAIACGVMLFFGYANTPKLIIGLSLIASGASSLIFWKRWPWVRLVLIGLFLVGIGFCAAYYEQYRLSQTLLQYSTPVLPLKGTIEAMIDDEDGKQKLVLSAIEVEGGFRKPLPEVIRLSLKRKDARLKVGQQIALRGGLFPLPATALPGGFDFSHYFYFKHIGAVGFAVPPIEILAEPPTNSAQIWLSNFRSGLAQSMSQTLNPYFSKDVAAISIALITGDRAGISEDAKEAMRVAGLAHMLAISGLHLGLVTAFLFVILRMILVLVPTLALRFAVKKWAAVGALLGGLAYLALADFPVSAQRAFVMVALVLLAVILDRQVMAMRSLALAAIVILMIAPSSLLGPSFQLSFIATLAIIAFFESWYRWKYRRTDDAFEEKPRPISHRGIGAKIVLYFGAVLATTFVASMITSPFTVFHFNQFTNYHLLANVAASPLFSFLVMPAGVMAILLMPLGLEEPFLWLMGQGVEWVIAIATAIAHLPNAMMHVPTPASWTIILFSFGTCWLCLWQSKMRHVGWLIMAISIVPFFTTRLPDIVISEKAEQIAVRLDDGSYAMLQGSARNFKAGLWQEALGIEGFGQSEIAKSMMQCDVSGCLYQLDNALISFPKWREAADEDCGNVDAIIADFYVECAQSNVIERPRYATSVKVNSGAVEIESAIPFSARFFAQD